ncbi:MAG: MBL fold metallo-hydrolase [Chthoniobacterales bacterium]
MRAESGAPPPLELLNSQHLTINSQLRGELRLTFLGTGTSQGVPMIGCDCAVCHSTDPRDNRLRSSVYIETPECAFVVDTGTDFRTQALRENIRHLDAVVFTHSHTDHVMGFDDLRRFNAARGYMPVYASAETMDDLRRVYAFAFEATNPFPGYLKPEPHIVEGPFQLGATTLTPLPVPHGHASVNGYLLTRGGRKLVAYLSDCSAVPDEVAREISGVDTLIIDALREKPHPTHLSVGQAIEVATRVGAAKTFFTHVCHELPAAAEATLPANTRIAYDGLKLEW